MSESVVEDAEYDPFAEFDKAMGSESVRDPYPGFAELRKQGPVVKMEMGTGFDLARSVGSYAAVTYDAVTQVLRHPAISSSAYADSMGLVMGHSILEMDEPEHHTYRGLIQQAFTRKAMETWETELVEPIVNGYIDRFASRDKADLVRELTFPFPVHVIGRMMGLAEGDLGKFHRWAVELISIMIDIERGLAASQSLRDFFAEVLAKKRVEPDNGIISVLAQAELDGTTLTDEEIFAFLRLLAPAGAETTYRSSSNLFFGLLSNPDQLDALRSDRELMNRAIEEGLRWEPPLTGIGRTAKANIEVLGVTIPAGSPVMINMGAANRDETRWDNAEAFDILREEKPHVSFAYGPHMCLGMHLARMETRVVVNAVLDRLPNLRLDPAAEDVHITGQMFRAPQSLPVLFG